MPRPCTRERNRRGIWTACVLSTVLAAIGAAKAYPSFRGWQIASWPVERLRAESETHPADIPLQLQLGKRLLDVGEAAEAQTAAARVVRMAPENPEAWTLLGQTELDLHRDLEAEQALERALQLDSTTADAHLALGDYYTRQGSSHGAIDHLRQYTRLRPGDPRGWQSLTRSFLEIGEPGNALEAAQRVLKERPRDAEAFAAAGEACRRLARFDEAETFFQRALASDPHHPGAHTGLGRVCLARSREPAQLAAAVEHLREAVRTAPADVDARYELGQALAQQGHLEEAVREWRAVLAQTPGETRCRYALAQGLARLGRSSEAEAHQAALARERRYQEQVGELVRRIRNAPDPASVQFQLARIHLREGHLDRAAEALRAGLAVEPQNGWARQMLARCAGTP